MDTDTSYDVQIVKIGPTVFEQFTLLPNPQHYIFTMGYTLFYKCPFQWEHLHPDLI